jgi:hypothetical protein
MTKTSTEYEPNLCRDCLYHLLKAGTKRSYCCDKDTCTNERLGEWDTDRILAALAERDQLKAENERLVREVRRGADAVVIVCYDLDRMEDERDRLKAENERIKAQVLGYRAGEHMSWTIERWQKRAEAWKSVYERMLDCESGHPNKRRENALELARALKAARALELEPGTTESEQVGQCTHHPVDEPGYLGCRVCGFMLDHAGAQKSVEHRRAEAWKAVAEDLEDYARHTGSSRVGVCVTNYDTKKCSCRLWDVFEDMEAARALELEPGTVEEEEEEGRV